jgi:hypothetical protein
MLNLRNKRLWVWLASAGVACAAAYLLFALIRSSTITEPKLKTGSSGPNQPAAPAPKFDPADALLGTDSSVSSREMQLILVATAPGRTPKEGTATLGTNPRNPQTYAAGAQLVNGAVIEEIYHEHVVLELNGIRSQLTVGQKSLFQRLTSRTPETGATTVGGAVAHQPLETVASSREDLSEIIRPEPVFDDRGFVGLRILAGRYSHKLDALGLKSGDIVRTIEGKPLKSADSAWQTIDDALSTGSSIVVSIEREGTLSSVILDGSQIIESATQVNPLGMGSRPRS